MYIISHLNLNITSLFSHTFVLKYRSESEKNQRRKKKFKVNAGKLCFITYLSVISVIYRLVKFYFWGKKSCGKKRKKYLYMMLIRRDIVECYLDKLDVFSC